MTCLAVALKKRYQVSQKNFTRLATCEGKDMRNKGRFCNTIASVAFLTPKLKEICHCRQRKFSQAEIKNKTKSQSFSEIQVAISLVVHSTNGFYEHKLVYIERGRTYLNIYRWHFIFVVQKLSSKCFNHTLKNTSIKSPPNRSVYQINKMPAVDV